MEMQRPGSISMVPKTYPAEGERVFSSAGNIVTQKRTQLDSALLLLKNFCSFAVCSLSILRLRFVILVCLSIC